MNKIISKFINSILTIFIIGTAIYANSCSSKPIVETVFDPNSPKGVIQIGINAKNITFEDFQKSVYDESLFIDDYRIMLRLFPISPVNNHTISYQIGYDRVGIAGRTLIQNETQKNTRAKTDLFIENAQAGDIVRAPISGNAYFGLAVRENGDQNLYIRIDGNSAIFYITMVDAKLLATNLPNIDDYAVPIGPDEWTTKDVPIIEILEGSPIAEILSSHKSQWFPGQIDVNCIAATESTSQGRGHLDIAILPDSQGKIIILQ
jgi:hypothetical protein